jgi:hypothetical protein
LAHPQDVVTAELDIRGAWIVIQVACFGEEAVQEISWVLIHRTVVLAQTQISEALRYCATAAVSLFFSVT